MQGETGENPVRARRREAWQIQYCCICACVRGVEEWKIITSPYCFRTAIVLAQLHLLIYLDATN